MLFMSQGAAGDSKRDSDESVSQGDRHLLDVRLKGADFGPDFLK